MAWTNTFAPKLYDAAYEYFNSEYGILVQPDGAVYKTDTDANPVEITEAEWTAIESKLDQMTAEYNAIKYQYDRKQAYPDLGDQLDMLYHDIKAGTLETGDWITAIEAIKAANPKP